MRPRGWALIIGAGAACLTPAAAAQTVPAGQPTPAQHHKHYLRAPKREGRALAVDMDGARGRVHGADNLGGRQIDLKFIHQNKVLIDQITIPVLLPSEPALAEHLRIFPNEAHYAVSSSAPGLSFHMTGHGKAFDLDTKAVRRFPHADLRDHIPADGVLIERSEVGLDAAFSRFGAAYSISLECADPTDRRCADDAFVRSLITHLIVVIPGDAL